MLLALLIYGYATRVFSSRALERATYDSVAVRFIAGNEHPDHDTIATFRKRFLGQIEPLFVEVLKLARAMGMLKLGTVALDGTKMHANASRHSALSYGHAKKLEKQLKREVKQLLRLAEEADGVNVPDGMSIPEELNVVSNVWRPLRRRRRRSRPGCRSVSRPSIRPSSPRARRRRSAPGRSRAGAPRAAERRRRRQGADQLTDEDSRIMPVAGGGFDQCYNAQAVVATESLLIVANAVTQAANDKQQLAPMLGRLKVLPKALGRVRRLLADSGYASEANVERCAAAKIEPLIALGREPHHAGWRKRFAAAPKAPPDNATPLERMAHGCERRRVENSTPCASKHRSRCSAASSRRWASASSCCEVCRTSKANGTW